MATLPPPRQTIPILYRSFCNKLFPNIQPMFPLVQLKIVSSCSVSCYLEKQTNTHLTIATLQEVVGSDKVTSDSPFLQA